ncbi:unnamed protein product [Fusarium equiseti]|uniref:Uncharacterized protein n=1 Tax=Fusarium equiseti TaxID=61235 RepID=A0A8J2NPG1_FUSEQ|nr:unnamed protein product [Fusarium equiseti]
MDSSDVRQVYDFELDRAAPTSLANYLPFCERIQWSTAIDCLIVAIRHIYCNRIVSLDLLKEFKLYEESEGANLILRHARHMFGLYPIQPSAVSRPKGIAIFIQNSSTAEVVKARLTLQTLISNRGLNMSSTEARIFRDVLPQFNHDYPLAMMLALDCNPAIRRYKAYFIAVLISGIAYRFKDADITLQDVKTVFRVSRHYGSSLPRHGTTWVILGLVRLPFSGAMASADTNQLTGIVEFSEDGVKAVRNTYVHLLYAIQEHGLHHDSLPFETAEDGLSKDNELRFHTDLFLNLARLQ